MHLKNQVARLTIFAATVALISANSAEAQTKEFDPKLAKLALQAEIYWTICVMETSFYRMRLPGERPSPEVAVDTAMDSPVCNVLEGLYRYYKTEVRGDSETEVENGIDGRRRIQRERAIEAIVDVHGR